MDILGEKDRLCLVEFSNRAKRLTNLKSVKKENLKGLKSKINSIYVGGGKSLSYYY